MKQFLFTEEEKNLIKFIKSNKPKNIWSNVIQYIFNYDEFYINFEIKCCEKFILEEFSEQNLIETENGSHNIFEQYVMFLKIEKINNCFLPNEASEKINSKEKIKEIYLVRSMYYFTKHREIKGNKNRTFSRDSGIINPKFEIDRKFIVESKYLVDTGIVIILENDVHLNCFVHNNDEDFGINEFYINDNLIETEKEKYEFIKI